MKIIKKFNYIIFILITIFAFITPINAQETTISTTIPETHKIDIVITGEGTIEINGIIYHKGDRVSLNRGQKYQFVFQPFEGYRISKVLVEGKDVTDLLKGNSFECEGIYQDGAIEVEYELINQNIKTDEKTNVKSDKKTNVNSNKKSQIVQTGDQQSMLVSYLLCMLSVVCMLAIIRRIDVLK